MSICKTVVAFAFVCASLASARQIENWPYDRLFKEADLVVIASAKEVKAGDEPAPEVFGGAASTRVAMLEVNATLKGEAKGGRVEVLHYKLKDGVMSSNGPMLVTFRTTEIRIDTQSLKAVIGPPEYLVFLKAEKDGRYVPVSGHYDARLSVREVYQPLSPRIFGEEPAGKPLRHE
jgi:hypothetical protein